MESLIQKRGATGNLAAYWEESGTVSIFIANSDGTFQPKMDFSTGGRAVSIIAADFNADGKIDLATGNTYGMWFYGRVSILIGNGDGTFQRYSDIELPWAYMGMVSMASNDFNGDGIADIATALAAGPYSSPCYYMLIFIGNGDGTFREVGFYIVDAHPTSITAGDFNGDQKVDIALAKRSAVSIFIGNGDGTFQSNINPLPAAESITTGDFNLDGKIDLVTASGNVSVFIGNGDGTFQEAIYFPVSGKVATGDFNDDGWTDIVAASGGTVSILIGKGDGTFQEAISFPGGGNSSAITVGDFNNDGKTDVATANYWNNDISVLLNIYHSPPPVASAGPDQIVECAAPSGSSVTLNGSASSGPDGDPLTYTWTWDGGSTTGVNPTISLPLGTTVITLTVSDGKTTATDTVNITVQDTTPPVTTATGGSENWYNANVISTFSTIDSCSGVKEIHYTVNGAETIIPGSSASAVIASEGTNNITYFAVDNAGNIESASSFTVKIDKTPPTGSVTINGDAVTTTSTAVALSLSVTDNLSGVSQMRFSNDNANWTAWEPYNTSKNWTLFNASDLMTVYVQFMDVAGNVSASYSDAIYMDTDNDGIYDSIDNCPNVNNPLQEDRNGNGIGDACDGDIDGDTIVDIRDNCPTTSNLDQLDSDGDGVGDVCDACINDPQNNCLNSSAFVSADITQPVTVSNFADTASVTIEPGDISTDTSITVTGETSTSNFAWGSNQQVLGAIYTFTADPSSTFSSPVTITLKYDQGSMPEGGRTEQNLDIYYYDTATLTWMPQNAIQDMLNNTLTLDTSHFSSYAVITTENPISDLAAAFKEIKIENSGIWASLFEKIGYAYNYYEQGDLGKTKETLNAFIKELKALSGKKLDSTSADMLVQFANEIMARL